MVGETVLPLPAHLAPLANKGAQDILLGIRPNAMSMGGESGRLAGRVVLVEHVGAESIVSVKLENAKTAHSDDGVAGDEAMVVEQGYSDLRAGQVVRVGLDLAEAVLFSRDGKRIVVPALARAA